MKVIRTSNYEAMSRQAANIISAQIILKPESILGLATGSTPIGIYKQLIEWYKKGDLDFSQVKTVNLDEYCGLSGDHDQSYRWFMNHNLFNHVNIDMANTNVPSGIADNLNQECERYDKLIKELGGVDIQLLGIGHNGHIGFNEPNDYFDKETHVVDLKQSTIDANARFFSSINDVPKQAITMGIQSIMAAKKILLVASGPDKKDILEKAVYGPVTPLVPASILQMHPDLTVVYSVD
ncbi:MAG TPA: glucosamine-6-phosphate deaminase [Ruminococcaceae bacterium]|jgi:glucosamine-6-phosphate deaminase|nr:glucosamine-6-phosphate deaminase [Oscillospiraceae bacterium]